MTYFIPSASSWALRCVRPSTACKEVTHSSARYTRPAPPDPDSVVTWEADHARGGTGAHGVGRALLTAALDGRLPGSGVPHGTAVKDFACFFFACNGTERICRANYQITSGNKGSVSLVRDEEIRDEELQEASLPSDKEHANYTGILSSAKAVATISNLETSAPSFPSYSVTVRTLE